MPTITIITQYYNSVLDNEDSRKEKDLSNIGGEIIFVRVIIIFLGKIAGINDKTY